MSLKISFLVTGHAGIGYGIPMKLLRIRALWDNMEAMNNAWNFCHLSPGERYFAKLLFSKDETAALNRNNFQHLATAAIAAAQFETPSMRFY